MNTLADELFALWNIGFLNGFVAGVLVGITIGVSLQ